MINFKKQQNIIKDYIEKYYMEHLEIFLNSDMPYITTEYLDFDKFKKNFVCYIEFDNSNFPDNKFNDDCGKTQNTIINIYLAHRNNTPENLNTLMLDTTSSFVNMIYENEIENVFNQKINNIEFFKYIEGANNIFCSKIILNLTFEV